MGVLKARLKKSQVVIESIRIPGFPKLDGSITLPLKASSISGIIIPNGPNSASFLFLARIERRVNVDQLRTSSWELLDHLQVVTKDDSPLYHTRQLGTHSRHFQAQENVSSQHLTVGLR